MNTISAGATQPPPPGPPAAMPRALQTDPAAAPTGLDALITIEAALVTVSGAALAADPGFTPADVTFLRAMQCQDEAHYHWLQSLGAVPTTPVFAVAPGLIASREATLGLLLSLKDLVSGAGMALVRGLDGALDPTTLEILFALGGVETGHAVTIRSLLAAALANDRAFLPWRFADPVEALNVLAETGLLDPRDDAVPFPGPLPRQCRGVVGLVPETTDDALLWDLPAEERRRVR